MCSRAGNWQCCVRFGITADLPSVTKAATTDWTAKWSDWEKPTILLFCLFPTVNVFWFWKSMCDCNIFYCTTALKCDSVRCHLHWVRPSEPHALTKNTCLWEQIQQVRQSSYLGRAWILVEGDLCGYIIVADFALWMQIFHVLA